MVKSEVKFTKCEGKASKYPYLGHCENSGAIVLFTGKATGALLADTVGYAGRDAGYSSNNWLEREFTKLEGSVTLSND